MFKTNNIKYTDDNKKVKVIGKLNNTDWIVQEIYIDGKTEVPSGEQFVTKSLHEKPLQSWKEKNLKELEERYEKDRVYWNNLIDKQKREFSDLSKELGLRTQYLKKVATKFDFKEFENVIDLIEGRVKYYVKKQYGAPELHKFSDFKLLEDRELKLLSLFGKDDGSMTFRLNQYSEGSGSYTSTEYYFFTNKKEATEKIEELFLSQTYITEELIKSAKEYGFELDETLVQEFKNKKIAEYENYLTRNTQDREKALEKMKEIEQI